MPVRQRGNLNDLRRRIRRGAERGLRDLTLEVKRQVQKENPVDTGRSRNAWASTFNPARLLGVVGNNVRYIRIVAEGGVILAHTIRARRARALRFKPRGSNQFIFRKQVHVPARRVPSTPKEKRNIGFHKRGAEKALRRAPELLLRALRREGVPV
jgi:hypothetical protein